MSALPDAKVLSISPAVRRDNIVSAIDSIVDLLEEEAPLMEAGRAPTARVVEAMHSLGLTGLKSPLEAGGDEADWTLQTEVFEKVAYHNLSAAWCLTIYADNTGMAAASLSDAGLARIMAGGGLPVVCGGGGRMLGDLTPVEGGYRLTGRWIFGSGIPQAEYALVLAKVVADGAPVIRGVIVPVCDMVIEDNWHVLGLKGTGSSDFSASDIFIPEDLVFDPQAPRPRGGALFKLGTFGYAGLCLPGLAIGATRRALEDLAGRAAAKSRGYTAKTTLAHRGVFQSFLGEADMQLKACRQLAITVGEQVIRDAERLGKGLEANDVEARAVGAYCMKHCIEIMNGIVSYAGGEGARAGHNYERTLRDLHMAGTHMYVSNIALENHAQFLMNLPDASLNA